MSTMVLDRPMRPARSVVVRPPSTLRLTRRGRVVVLLTAVLLAFVVGVLVAASSVATQEPGTPEPTRIVTVSSGDTLWGIASEMTPPGGDVRDTMERIERLNALESGMLQSGQRLVVPR